MLHPKIIDLNSAETQIIQQLAHLVYESFKEFAPGWLPTLEDARQEILESLEPGKISRVLLDANGEPLGWIGAMPHNRGRVWEIHPLVVAAPARGRGYGRRLVEDLEALLVKRDGLTLVAGTSDESNATTLGGIDLYADPIGAMAGLRSLKNHPYEFYVKIGFKVVGVIPDAEGRGKPAISLARRIGERSGDQL